ncbi:MAG TPA: Ig-like domain-containing protein [Gemmatimonadales bacterium]|nr:Ig-like domain-containing protein [Gemmatimonadales bacterium]
MTVWPRGLRPLGPVLSLLAACRDDPAGLARGGPGYVAVRPAYPSAVDLSAFGLNADTVRIVVVRPPADTLRTLTAYFDPDSSEIRLTADVRLRAAVETLTVHLELRGGGFALFSGTRPVPVRAGRPGPPQEIPVTYTGPGTTVAAVTIVPRDTVLTFGDSLQFRVTARDSAGAPVTSFYVAWSTSDTSLMRVNAAGLARAPGGRAALSVRVRTPTGVGDSTPLTIIPVPTTLAPAGGSGQSAVVGSPLAQPLRVRVTAGDGLGVKGIPVRFRPLGGLGAAVADSLVVSDAGGYAQTPATLGTVAGPQSFEASAPALPAVTFGGTATPDAASPVTSIVTASAASLLSGGAATLTLLARDRFGNPLTTGGLTVVFAATGGTSTGAVTATTDHGDGTYTATFTGVRAGSATTITATIGGIPVTSTLPAIAVSPGPLARVLVSPPSATLGALGVTQAFGAVAQDASGNVVPGQTFSWMSSAPGVATVDPATGLATAIGNGPATITATAAGVAGGASVTVAQVVAGILVSPASGTIAALTDTLRFTAVAKDARGNVIPGQGFAWSSSAPGVADIDQTGLAIGLAAGSVTINATAGGVSATAALSVAQAVATVIVTPASRTLTALGVTQQFSAVARDAGGNVVPGQTFTWTSSPGGVAAVNPTTGLATAIGNGAATITATASGVSGTASLSVAQVVASVAVAPASATLGALGLTQQFSAVAKDANGYVVAGPTFTWTSFPGGVASVDPATGLATALGSGAATITATTGGVSGTASLSVAQVVTAVTVSPAAATLAAVGLAQQFTALAKDANGNTVTGQLFAWSSSVPAIASVDQTGLATGLAIGSATITATAAGVAGTATLSVAQAIASVDVTPATATLTALGLTQRFSAVAKDAGGTVIPGQSFAWTSSDGLIATVDPSGLVTALANGPATITATTGGVSGAATLTVSQVVTSVVVSPATATLSALGLTQQFSAVALDGNGRPVAGQAFTWASSVPAIASVDQTGLATGLAIGSVTIGATAAGVAGTATLSVAQLVTSIDVSPGTATLDALGLTRQFTATARDANGNAILGQSFSWASSAPGVATAAPATGLVTAIGNGPTTITATAGGVTGSAQLLVAQVVSSVNVSPATAALGALGLSQQFGAVARDAKGNAVPGQAFSWTSLAPGVATVDPATGLATALANGTATITATTAGVSGSATLGVLQVVVAVDVSPATATLSALGLTQHFDAIARDARGNPVPDRTFTWKSSAVGVATVDASGLATAIGNGPATVTATTAGVSGSASVTVAQVVVRVDVSPAAASLPALGLTQQFSAVARDANGNPVPGQPFTWTSSAPLIVSVDQSGLARGLAIGSATITAATGGVSGTAILSIP